LSARLVIGGVVLATTALRWSVSLSAVRHAIAKIVSFPRVGYPQADGTSCLTLYPLNGVEPRSGLRGRPRR
jgi:hypothetical protein